MKASVGKVRLVCHHAGALRLRLATPDLKQLQNLFNNQSFWAQGRTRSDLRQMLRGSQAIVSAWEGTRLIGFGRATSDGIFRAVLWDVVVTESHQGQGVGRAIVERLLNHRRLAGVERIYLMTTNSAGFYQKAGFEVLNGQQVLVLHTPREHSQGAGTEPCG